MRNGLGALAVASVVVITACGGSESGVPTQPSPAPAPAPVPTPPPPAAPVVVHNTLQPADNQVPSFIYYSASTSVGASMIVDDFVSPANVQARVLKWQGGYCDPRFQVPFVAPKPVARSFRIVFAQDNPAAPSTPLSEVTVPVTDTAEQLLFEVPEARDVGCGSKIPSSYSYYAYTLTLPQPVALTAGRKYWLTVQANVDDSGIWWGWRRGLNDNLFALNPVFGSYWELDMAFWISS